MTTPSSWTSSYGDAFRDRRKFISPREDQPMYHYRGTYDKSHNAPANNGAQGQYAVQNGSMNSTQGYAAGQNSQSQSFNQTTSSSSYSTTVTNTPNAIPAATGFGYHFPKAIPGGKDLWNERPNASHGGIVGHSGVNGASSIAFESRETNFSSSSNGASGDGQFSGSTDNMSGLGPDSRPKYHVPGYSGFVRGEQFRFGDTYGKTTRMALDVPTDMPLEP